MGVDRYRRQTFMGIDPLSCLFGREACVRLVENIIPSLPKQKSIMIASDLV
jgi:hypothetical protein